MALPTDARRYHQGLAAEEIAARAYMAEGAQILGTRVRTKGGEIDLIVASGDTIVFVEVKARRSHAAATASLGPRQQARLMTAAGIWLADTGRGALTPCRFDLATVDAAGTLEILRNALG